MGEQARKREMMDSEILRFDASAWCTSEFERRVVNVGRTSFVMDSVSGNGYKLYWDWKRRWSCSR